MTDTHAAERPERVPRRGPDPDSARSPDGGAGADVPAIELTSVSKDFHAHGEVVTAVRGVDLAIRQGEFFSMLGPSGCGKTTTMRMIAGFEECTTGSVYLYGRDVTGVPPNKRDVNMVFQSYALFPHMNVFENVAFGLRRRRIPAATSAAGCARCSRSSTWAAGKSGARASCPVASSSGSRSRVRL